MSPDPLWPLLNTRADHFSILNLGSHPRPLDEFALTRPTLDEIYLTMRKRDSQRQAGESRARTYIGDGGSRAHKLQLEGDERIGEVHGGGARRIAHRCRSELILSQRRQNRRELVNLAFRQAMTYRRSQPESYVPWRDHQDSIER